MTRLFKLGEIWVHDHLIVFIVMMALLITVWYNYNYLHTENCHVLDPSIDCAKGGMISRSNFTSMNPSQYEFTPYYYSIYHEDEYRLKNGFLHALFPPNSAEGTYHYDTFNGVVNGTNFFGMISHIADSASTECYHSNINADNLSCFGYFNFMIIVLIWSGLIAIIYYPTKEVFLHRKQIKKWF